ncbi:winged helix-turn-helix transcriptional regulator [Candidatus Methanomassiliicoccus intestinalis]|uniref:winged helix-turn-helix transcriptional regulator n=1 Tax=Candidatus Methanomassiliicoccus intestinalis TaxID=1406512 RepID=UPI000C79FE77
MTKRLENEVSLLERHVKMLKTIKENEPIGIIRLAELLGHPQHKVRYSLRILEQEGLIVPSPDGAVTTEKFDEFMKDIDRLLEDMEKAVNRLKIELKSP